MKSLWNRILWIPWHWVYQTLLISLEKVNFRYQILECPSIGEYWSISGVSVLPENVIFTFWLHPEANNTGTPKWSTIVQYSCTSIWDLKYTFPFPPSSWPTQIYTHKHKRATILISYTNTIHTKVILNTFSVPSTTGSSRFCISSETWWHCSRQRPCPGCFRLNPPPVNRGLSVLWGWMGGALAWASARWRSLKKKRQEKGDIAGLVWDDTLN